MAKNVKKSKEYRKPAHFQDEQAKKLGQGLRDSAQQRESTSNPMLLISAGLVTCVFLFVYYHLLTMHQMTDLSNGLSMPDQRVFGYTVSDIEALRAAMDSDATGQLNYLHKTAGLLFPLLTGLFSMLIFIRWIPNRQMRWLAWLAPLLFAVTDLWENFAIDSLFGAELNESTVVLASILTTIRWATLFITAALVFGLAARRANKAMIKKMAEIRQHSS
ncbi:hypothetical protein ACT3UD_08360 [Glutamicibacter sp. 287]|uniref:hypothetical protein n=1 Tax=unclassified Glutamicibacter TaxID=2627139 RepID=UPI000BB794E7|nr:hypothetical protein [Glutamicibacter sp. BW80]PCC27205.1 hypothetical protein CIK76_18455 [Glutamicibacter sp. BW80]